MKSFFLGLLGNELYVFACSMLPVIELRGSIPLGAALGLHPVLNYMLSVVGNLLPVPFILLLINAVIKWMATSKVKFFNKIANFSPFSVVFNMYFLLLFSSTFLST